MYKTCDKIFSGQEIRDLTKYKERQTMEKTTNVNEIITITNIINSMVKMGVWQPVRIDIEVNVMGSYVAVVWLDMNDLNNKVRVWATGNIEKEVK